MKARPKSTGQVKTIFASAKQAGIDEDGIRDIVADITMQTRGAQKCTRHISALSHAEAEKVIQRIKGRSFVPLRTLQYRRQRAGVEQIITADQEKKIAELASQRHWSAETLINFFKRQCGHYPLRTTIDANKVIEALKSMNERNGLWAA